MAQRVPRPHTGAVGAETPVGRRGGGAAVGAAGRSGTRTRWAAVEGAAGRWGHGCSGRSTPGAVRTIGTAAGVQSSNPFHCMAPGLHTEITEKGQLDTTVCEIKLHCYMQMRLKVLENSSRGRKVLQGSK